MQSFETSINESIKILENIRGIFEKKKIEIKLEKFQKKLLKKIFGKIK